MADKIQLSFSVITPLIEFCPRNAITNYWKMVAYEELVDDGVEQVKVTLDENMESMEMRPDRTDPDPVYSLPDVDRNQVQSEVKKQRSDR